MTERSDTEVFQVLVCQIAEDREIDIVISKALSILAETELLKPIRNLLHRRPPYGFDAIRSGPAQQFTTRQ